jgi:CheY-like chemotaxis protein
MRVLILEDHSDTRLVMERAMAHHGHEVKSFAGAGAILEYCAHGNPFDLLISDIGLPDQNGMKTLPILRESCRPFKAIAVTAFARAEELEACRAAGFDGVLAKPISFQLLREEIERVCQPQPKA